MPGEQSSGDAALPQELQVALREWAANARDVVSAGDPEARELVTRRGRQLAFRAAAALGRPVEFVDPVTGAVESVGVKPGAGPAPGLAPEPAGPTPWASGLAVSAFFAVAVGIGDVVLSRAFGSVFGWLWVPANLLVTIGIAPTLWLARSTPFWRWLALGTVAGLAAAWVVLLLGLLA